MSKALDVLLELKDCSDYWSEYFVPLGIHERIDDAIKELLAQPEQENLTPRQGLEEYKKGYAQAELDSKREPLSDDKINNISKKSLEKFNYSDVDGDNNWAFRINEIIFAKAIEKYHGIGEDNE